MLVDVAKRAGQNVFRSGQLGRGSNGSDQKILTHFAMSNLVNQRKYIYIYISSCF